MLLFSAYFRASVVPLLGASATSDTVSTQGAALSSPGAALISICMNRSPASALAHGNLPSLSFPDTPSVAKARY